jgi:hypothetical protein
MHAYTHTPMRTYTHVYSVEHVATIFPLPAFSGCFCATCTENNTIETLTPLENSFDTITYMLPSPMPRQVNLHPKQKLLWRTEEYLQARRLPITLWTVGSNHPTCICPIAQAQEGHAKVSKRYPDTHAHARMHIRACTHTRIHAYTHILIHHPRIDPIAQAQENLAKISKRYPDKHAHTRMHIHACTLHAYTHTRIYSYTIHAYTHSNIHTCTHTHIRHTRKITYATYENINKIIAFYQFFKENH